MGCSTASRANAPLPFLFDLAADVLVTFRIQAHELAPCKEVHDFEEPSINRQQLFNDRGSTCPATAWGAGASLLLFGPFKVFPSLSICFCKFLWAQAPGQASCGNRNDEHDDQEDEEQGHENDDEQNGTHESHSTDPEDGFQPLGDLDGRHGRLLGFPVGVGICVFGVEIHVGGIAVVERLLRGVGEGVVTDPDDLERLFGVFHLALVWMHDSGERGCAGSPSPRPETPLLHPVWSANGSGPASPQKRSPWNQLACAQFLSRERLCAVRLSLFDLGSPFRIGIPPDRVPFRKRIERGGRRVDPGVGPKEMARTGSFGRSGWGESSPRRGGHPCKPDHGGLLWELKRCRRTAWRMYIVPGGVTDAYEGHGDKIDA
eukprot:scaffold1141_cov333-Pavlova_lutheri.AAC.18